MVSNVTNVRGLDQELKRQVRLVALQQGITLGQALNQAMALWLVREVTEGRARVELVPKRDSDRRAHD